MSFRDDLGSPPTGSAAYLERVRRAAGRRGRAAGRGPRAAARRRRPSRVSRSPRARRPGRGDPAGDHALEPPALLRLLRDHRLRARHPRRAARRGAQRERDGLARLAGRDRARGDGARLARAAARAAARVARSHRGHRVDLDAGRARGGAHARPGGVVVRLRAGALLVEKAARLLGLEFRTVAGGRRRTACAPTSRSTTRRRWSRRSGTTVDDVGRPGCRARRALPGRGRMAPRRRRLRRLGGGLPGAPLVPGRRRGRRLRSSSTRTNGCSRRWTARRSGRGGPRRSARRSRSCRTTCGAAERRSTSSDYGPRSGAGFARSSCGRCSAATAPRGCAG